MSATKPSIRTLYASSDSVAERADLGAARQIWRNRSRRSSGRRGSLDGGKNMYIHHLHLISRDQVT